MGKTHHYIFIIAELWLTYYPRNTVVPLDTGTPGTSREIFSEDADDETRISSSFLSSVQQCAKACHLFLSILCIEIFN